MNNPHPFDRSGIAPLSDLDAVEWKQLYSQLDKEQGDFLAKENHFRSPEYKWPRNALHNWSRVWEYPYAYHHIRSWRESHQGERTPLACDVGSGAAFFPFSIARLGCRVACVDNDPICGKDLMKASECVATSPGAVEFRLTDGKSIPLEDQEADIVYCVSVLEHIPTFELTIREMARVLKPAGLLVLTIDLDTLGIGDIRPQRYGVLIELLKSLFRFKHAQTTVHPANMLRSSTGPYPLLSRPRGLALTTFALKQYVLKPLLGRPPAALLPIDLTVEGLVMEKL